MACRCKRSIYRKGNGYAASIPIEFLYALEGDPTDYHVLWGFDDNAKKPCIRFQKKD